MGRSIARAMIHEFPSLLTCKDAYGRLPLHALCSRPRKFAKMDKQNPVSVTEMNEKAQYDANLADLIELYCMDYPEAAHRRDEEGCLPLHLCLQNKQGLSVMRVIVQAFPMAAQCQNSRENTAWSGKKQCNSNDPYNIYPS